MALIHITPTSPYRDFIASRQKESPCISNLSSFLTPSHFLPPNSSQLYAVDFLPKTRPVRPLHHNDLASTIASLPAKGGRIIVIEDLHPSALDILGPKLDIDPIFFADYVVTDLEDPQNSPAPPSVALTPSQILAQKDAFHIHYQQIVNLTSIGRFDEFPWVLKTYGNVPRSVRRLPQEKYDEPQLGIVRGCCSILTRKFPDSWIAIILIDSTTTRIISRNPQTRTINIDQTPFHSNSEFLPHHRSSFSQFVSSNPSLSLNPSSSSSNPLLNYILSSLTSLPIKEGFTVPTPLDLALHCLLTPIINSWMIYSQISSNILKRSEFLTTSSTSFSDPQIISLQKWRHRLIQSRHKLTATKEYIEHHSSSQSQPSSILILKDLTHLLDKLERYSRALDRIIPVAPALVQVHDHRRAVADQVFVKRLTYIAFVFVPASWVAAVFSMADEYGPGEAKFWVYFAITMPFCAVLVLGSFVVGWVGT
ncbi:hypothetical protein QBC38DRAFT_460419 [Podospora fimiseda]|uniref:Uncharacterized protein n=1 Tax=Podospora fimiseda TaxID=252190 RepID=A0AAN7BFM5_9PEZI|nr:hypothetical protein QBC38DRAFT_460419 [Podospora fimiseda]